MERRHVEGGRLELHVEATGRGRRMVARLADGTVVASGRHFSHLRENIEKVVPALYGTGVKVVLMVGPARRGPSLQVAIDPDPRPRTTADPTSAGA